MTDKQQDIPLEIPQPESTELNRVFEGAMTLKPIERLQLIQRLSESLLSHVTEEKQPRKSLYGIAQGQGGNLSLEDFQELRRELSSNFIEKLEGMDL
ncbi:hypothetical protein HC776_01840 [bacterium]|nr:hypothetical protein [bacterium]